jgi:putative transposase
LLTPGFGLITQKAARRGSFSSVKELVRKIERFVEHYNPHARPFLWTATAESIPPSPKTLLTNSGTAH